MFNAEVKILPDFPRNSDLLLNRISWLWRRFHYCTAALVDKRTQLLFTLRRFLLSDKGFNAISPLSPILYLL